MKPDLAAFCAAILFAPLGTGHVARADGPSSTSHVYPASDPTGAAGWVLNEDMSDEFDARDLDRSKWLVQGTDGEYRSHFLGRAPSQFSTGNVRIEAGKLKLQTRWEPDFPFSPKPDAGGRAYENITTAAVISKKQFLYGYMEIKCKAADASVTSSFWATGHHSELDVFEFMGAPSQTHKKHLEKEYMFTMIDWGQPLSMAVRSPVRQFRRVPEDCVPGAGSVIGGKDATATIKAGQLLPRAAGEGKVGVGLWFSDNPSTTRYRPCRIQVQRVFPAVLSSTPPPWPAGPWRPGLS